MTQFSDLTFEQSNAPQLCAALQAFSESKKAALATHALPTRKTESWKYSAKYIGKQEDFIGDTKGEVDTTRLQNAGTHEEETWQSLTVTAANRVHGSRR